MMGWVLGVGMANPHTGEIRGRGCDGVVVTADGLVWLQSRDVD